MIDHLRAMAVFAKTIECGSFRGAAKTLDLSPSVVSHHISQLESALGVALLYRSTRRFSLTSDGEQLFAAARAMVEAAEHGLSRAASRAIEPSGHLTITAPAVLMSGPLAEDLAAFSRSYPKVTMAIRSTDTPVDLIREGVDLAVRASLSLQDSELKRKKLFTMPRVLVASPIYVAAKRAPTTPNDLASWDWIRLAARPANVRFIGASRRVRVVHFDPKVTVDSAQVVIELARNALGLAVVPMSAAAPVIAQGALVQVLEAWKLEAANVFAIWPPNAPRLGLAMRFVDLLVERHRTRVTEGSSGPLAMRLSR